MADSALSELLACPRCDSALKTVDGGYRCPGCRVDFPELGGIPWLFADPGTALAGWRERLNFLLKKLEHDGTLLGRSLERQDLHALTRRRLEHLRSATAGHAEALQGLLAPLELSMLEADYETYLALRTRLPSDQGLATYYNNIHRDWSWGDEENERSLQLVNEALQPGGEPGKTLILGAGAGRLAYDVHMAASPELTVALDFNPMLALVAKKVMAGEPLELYEFPIAPKGLTDGAVPRSLSAPAPVTDGFYLVLADALRAPFVAQGFDCVVTPWLVDILPETFPALCARINRLLKPGGRWINFGSLAFSQPDPAARYSLQECRAVMEASGFAELHGSEAQIPYMCSPASRHGRLETVITWSAAKKKKARRPPRHHALPDWLVKGEEPVPLGRSFEMQAASTRICAFIMSLIDGKRSLKEMAKVLVDQRLMGEEEAEAALRSFLIKMHEDSQREGGF